MTYNKAILWTESFKKWSHYDGHLVESPVTVRVMILLIPRKVISYDPISACSLSPLHTSINFFEGALRVPLRTPGALALAIPHLGGPVCTFF